MISFFMSFIYRKFPRYKSVDSREKRISVIMPVLNKEESDLALQVWQLVATDLEGNGAKFFRA